MIDLADKAFRVQFGASDLTSNLIDVEEVLTRWTNPGTAIPGA